MGMAAGMGWDGMGIKMGWPPIFIHFSPNFLICKIVEEKIKIYQINSNCSMGSAESIYMDNLDVSNLYSTVSSCPTSTTCNNGHSTGCLLVVDTSTVQDVGFNFALQAFGGSSTFEGDVLYDR